MRILVLGGGGHAKPVIEALRAMGAEVAGVLDDEPREAVLGAPWLGAIAELGRLRAQGLDQAAIAIGDNATRARLGALCLSQGVALPVIAHPSALISSHARLGPGAQVMARATVGPDAALGPLALVNTGAIVEHDVVLGEAAHLAPAAALCGFVRVGARALVGAGAVARPGVAIGDDAVIAAGAAVAEDVPP
ncbi:NeuD/PglB/VioB family sugar acetyltransferase, partial [Falsiroseomonas oryziterrae]|uniref:NeuD/PglB/VioB family sugar acetyltransferase n=1 Tax=Falsiroseomonas oryziterrae TaxID=2911368 RepID=UPI001EFFCA73